MTLRYETSSGVIPVYLKKWKTLNKSNESITKSSQKRPEIAFLNRIIHFPPLELAESWQKKEKEKKIKESVPSVEACLSFNLLNFFLSSKGQRRTEGRIKQKCLFFFCDNLWSSLMSTTMHTLHLILPPTMGEFLPWKDANRLGLAYHRVEPNGNNRSKRLQPIDRPCSKVKPTQWTRYILWVNSIQHANRNLTVLNSTIFFILSSYDVWVRTPGVRRVYQKTNLCWS